MFVKGAQLVTWTYFDIAAPLPVWQLIIEPHVIYDKLLVKRLQMVGSNQSFFLYTKTIIFWLQLPGKQLM